MNYLIIFLISVIIIFTLIMVLFADSKSSNSIHRKGNKLTIWHPLNKQVINLNSDVKTWNIQKIRWFWWGTIYSVNIELLSGKWKKIYSRSITGKLEPLISHLEKIAPEKKREP
tara:strand:+ start:279 stop:620 length:342 start_codon:yes stop_codon:yes gene_type:complete